MGHSLAETFDVGRDIVSQKFFASLHKKTGDTQNKAMKKCVISLKPGT
jgi:hypothetical protein